MSQILDRGLDSSSGIGFVRERLALLGKTLFLVSFGFYLFLWRVESRRPCGVWAPSTPPASSSPAAFSPS